MSEEIDALVSDNGEGDSVVVLMPPEMRKWQFATISVDDARVLAAKLVRAANLAQANARSSEIDF
jgi:hypothetical protein